MRLMINNEVLPKDFDLDEIPAIMKKKFTQQGYMRVELIPDEIGEMYDQQLEAGKRIQDFRNKAVEEIKNLPPMNPQIKFKDPELPSLEDLTRAYAKMEMMDQEIQWGEE